jgi:hypothetical protein
MYPSPSFWSPGVGDYSHEPNFLSPHLTVRFPARPRPEGAMTTKGDEQFDWNALAPRIIHPLKVAVIEALLWIDQPLSGPDFRKMFNERFTSACIAYHLDHLVTCDVLEVAAGRQQGRRMSKKLYFVSSAR